MDHILNIKQQYIIYMFKIFMKNFINNDDGTNC